VKDLDAAGKGFLRVLGNRYEISGMFHVKLSGLLTLIVISR